MSISKKKMIDFLDTFDPLQEKYLIRHKSKKSGKYAVDIDEVFSKLNRHEKNSELSHLQKLPTSYVGRTVNTVYGITGKQRMDSMKCFDRVRGSVINKFLNINGLELLFNEHYYDFEWDMHLEMNFEDSQYAYYRDHMEHQVRNMYMMIELLNNYGFIENITKIFSDKSNSKVSNYVYNRHLEYIDKMILNDHQRQLFTDCAKIYYEQIFEDYKQTNSYKSHNETERIEGFFTFLEGKQLSLSKNHLYDSILKWFTIYRDRDGHYKCSDISKFNATNFKKWINSINADELRTSYIKDYSIRYIIKSAAIISALFHDVSYPLCFFMNMQKRVGQYLPSMNAFTHNVEADIDSIVSTLRSSLLFILVSEKEIRIKLSKNQKKYDHGVFSAIALLLTFYESGIIHQLPIDKQIAIELAALAVYNHNFSYNINDEDAKEYYRPVFTQNPISFILKICDDMQEWDRRYFEISKVDENIFCSICGSPMIKYNYYDGDLLKETLLCGCEEKKYSKSNFFPYRNMYTVTTCHSVDVIYNYNNLIFKLNYDLLDLLHMSQISCTYASYRAKELNKLKNLMLNQKYASDDSIVKVRNMFLDYTMSSNPIYLKSRILIDYIQKESGFENIKNINSVYKKSKEIFCDVYYKKWIDDWHKFLKEKVAHKSISAINFSLIAEEFFFEKFKTEFINQKNNSLFLFLYLSFNQKADYPFCDLISQLELCNKHYIDKTLNLEDDFGFIKNYSFSDFETHLKIKIEEYVSNNIKVIYSKYIYNQVKSNKINFSVNTQNLCFYFKIAKFIIQSMLGSSVNDKNTFKTEILEEYIEPSDPVGKKHREIVIVLLDDIYSILDNQVDVYSNKFPNINKYTKQFASKKNVFHAIEKYNNPVNWYSPISREYIDFAKTNPDFYSDLLMFEFLGKKISNKY